MNVGWVDEIGRSLQDGFGMFWETLWALVLGFVLSGAIQAFVPRSAMRQALGDRRPRTIVKASFLGAVSSSCSYAASALAKTLFVRGADFTAAQAFMFASTNLVVELGIVLWLLLGWEFALAEFVGGAIMITLLSVVLPRVVRPSDAEAVRSRLLAADPVKESIHDHADHHSVEAGGHPQPRKVRIRSRAGWTDAAGYTVSDLGMLRREIVIGFVVAGFANVVVPTRVWTSLFWTGHGFGSSLENVLLGPLIAIASFVCSIGNVPLAGALWSGGISFGGVIAFLFADLVTLPLLLIYRRYYGRALTLRLLAVFWSTMSAAGLATEYIFRAAGIAPAPLHGGDMVGRDIYGWNYTTVLDVIAIVGLTALYLMYRRPPTTDSRFAKDPVCGMQVERALAPATSARGGEVVYFCSDHCRHRFEQGSVGAASQTSSRHRG